MNSLTRTASHANGWYTGDPKELAKELSTYLSKSKKYDESSSLKSIIVPHSGLCYGGPTAAKAFINVNPSLFDRAVILGPSHFEDFQGVGLTSFEKFKTPFGLINYWKIAVTFFRFRKALTSKNIRLKWKCLF